MTGCDQDEYNALRATIRERGTARMCIFVAGVAAWTAATIATTALASSPVASLLPLLLLACVFEAVFALHVGVERIGRYVQVFHEGSGGLRESGESSGSIGWEHAAMAFGRPRGAATIDALFTLPFLLAALFNIAPTLLLNPIPTDLRRRRARAVRAPAGGRTPRRRPAARDRSGTVSAAEARAALTTKARTPRRRTHEEERYVQTGFLRESFVFFVPSWLRQVFDNLL